LHGSSRTLRSESPELLTGADPLAENAHGEKAIDLARQNKALKDTPALKKLAELSVE